MASRPFFVHVRSASGPNLSRFAVGFAPYGGGDALWLAYLPDALRGWFTTFADTCDVTASGTPFRIARMFSSPTLADIDVLLELIRRRVDDGLEQGREPRQAAELAVAVEIERGLLHVTTLILDVHHLPTLTRLLRSDGSAFAERHHLKRPTPDWLARHAVQRARELARSARQCGLNLILATPTLTGADRVGSLANGLEAELIAALSEDVDLELVVGEDSPAASDRRFAIEVRQSRLPGVLSGATFTGATWRTLISELDPDGLTARSWLERLERVCPRPEAPPLALAEPIGEWYDETQETFVRWAEARGWTVERARSEEDRRDHWDVAISRPGERHLVDVKARSRIRRGDAFPRDDWHWVELRGVVDGGWLFAGKADLIAFQNAESFLLVRRSDLAEHVLHHVEPETVVQRQADAAYRVYHRLDRDDGPKRPTGADRGVLTLIPTARLQLIAWDGAPPHHVSPKRGRGDRAPRRPRHPSRRGDTATR